MPGIKGELCWDEKSIQKSARFRKNENKVQKINASDEARYKQDGWKVIRKYSKKVKIEKSKGDDEKFEDRVWMLFKNVGFSCLNKDRNCRLDLEGPYRPKQIDILAKDDDNVFVVDCYHSQSGATINARNKLEEWASRYNSVHDALKSCFGKKYGRVNIIVVISSLNKREEDEIFVKGRKTESLMLWSGRELSYLESLVKQIGKAAKYQLYSVIFRGRKLKKLKKEYPAIGGKMAGKNFYSFLISAKDLVKYTYIHHRKLTGIVETSETYQRMLKANKLKQIKNYIDKDFGYFPNSVIINFSEGLGWKYNCSQGNIKFGTLILPPYYGCAWVIDGQHRLYGAANAEREDVLLPVIAFEKMPEQLQGPLFVDINKKQTKVSPNLLWDLYSDIYRDSEEPRQKKLFLIAETAKLLAKEGPFKDKIYIESEPGEAKGKLSLETVCTTISKYSPWEKLIDPKDEFNTPIKASRIVNCYFEVLKELWPEEWEEKDIKKRVILTNNGFGVFMMLFRDIIKYLEFKERESLLRKSKAETFKKDLRNFFLIHVVEHLKQTEKARKDIRTKGGRGPQSDNAAELDLIIRSFLRDYNPPRLEGIGEEDFKVKEAIPAKTKIGGKVGLLEPIIRAFVMEGLKSFYGNDVWWKKGVPGDLKRVTDARYEKELKKMPWRKGEGDQNEQKLNFLGLGELKIIILYKNNWENIFAETFGAKGYFDNKISQVIDFRNPDTHKRDVKDKDLLLHDAIAGLYYFSKCLGCKELHPYS